MGSSPSKTNFAIVIMDEIELLTYVTRCFFFNFVQKHKQNLRKKRYRAEWISNIVYGRGILFFEIKGLVTLMVRALVISLECCGFKPQQTNLAIEIIDEIEILTFVTRYFFNNFEL